MESVFSRLPQSFFVPLASPNRRHYAALLLQFYRLFMEYRSSVERELLIARFSEYFAGLDSSEAVAVEEDTTKTESHSEEPGEPSSGGTTANDRSSSDPRALAATFLRKLIGYGWLDEEEQIDFSRIVTMRDISRPFLEALDATERGVSIEYESHIVAVYSSLCSDAAKENGEHAVLNAHWHTRLLVESLKVLEQNIRNHFQEIFSRDATIPEILHTHYDVYMQEVVDRAYTRLKTSDNLSRYRPRITRALNAFLKDERWMARTSERLSIIQRTSLAASKETVRQMLLEIRDELKSIDPILENIDDRNRRYSRISTERIRARLHADSSLQGRIARLVRAIARGTPAAASEVGAGVPRRAPADLMHRIFRLRYLSRASLFTRRKRVIAEEGLARADEDELDADVGAAELKLRITNQLNPTKIAAFLSQYCPTAGSSRQAEEIVDGVESFVRLIYAANYAEARDNTFPFTVEWESEVVTVGRFSFRSHRFVRRHTDG